MGGHEPRDPESKNVAYGPWAESCKPADPGSHLAAPAEHHAAVSSANAMYCENAPAPSFVRTQSPTPASSLPDHATASLPAEAYPSQSESHRDNLFLVGDPGQEPVPSPESRPPADDHPSDERGLVAPLGVSSWSATAAAHRPDPAKFTRPPVSVARRWPPTRPPYVSARLRLVPVCTVLGLIAAALACVALLGGPSAKHAPATADWRTELRAYQGAPGPPLPAREQHALASKHELVTIPASMLTGR